MRREREGERERHTERERERHRGGERHGEGERVYASVLEHCRTLGGVFSHEGFGWCILSQCDMRNLGGVSSHNVT